jgi:hypothetical protein
VQLAGVNQVTIDNGGNMATGGIQVGGGRFNPPTDGLLTQTGAIFQGSGVPNNANGNNGDMYFRTDTPATLAQRIYIKSAGAWVNALA